MLSSTLRKTHSCSSLPTHTRPERDTASTRSPRVRATSRASRMSEEIPLVTNSRLLLPRDQSPLPSRLTNSPSRDTTLVSSPTDVEPSLTMVSSPSDTVPKAPKSTSSSRTPGVPLGETRDTSRLLQTCAVSPTNHPTQLSEQAEFIFNPAQAHLTL